MSYTISGWRTDGFVVHGTDDATEELVRIEVSPEQHITLIQFLRVAAKSGWPQPKIEVSDDRITERRRMTLGDYGYNND